MNVTKQNQSLVKSEIGHYFIRLTILQGLNIFKMLSYVLEKSTVYEQNTANFHYLHNFIHVYQVIKGRM